MKCRFVEGYVAWRWWTLRLSVDTGFEIQAKKTCKHRYNCVLLSKQRCYVA